ncbi:MAG: nucleotide pyrophosphohydrolase [Nanoarchaeota archaeon]|nr:nucleotide pyrophosphohydrolase [Nanoarchaeota archaeon]
MSLKDVQRDVDVWTKPFEPQYWPPHEMLARMMEEVGELSREVNHQHGIKKKKPDEKPSSISKELFDILFTAACMANAHGIDLQAIWEENMREKQYGRDKDRFEKKK